MSRLGAFTKGWSFRTNKPDFEPGTEITAFVTGRENGRYVARVGDTILRVEEAERAEGDATSESENGGSDRNTDDSRVDLVDTQVRLRVEEFDTTDHTGRATVVERLDDGAF